MPRSPSPPKNGFELPGRRPAAASAPELRMAPLLPVPGLLLDAGIDPAPLLASSGIAATAFAEAGTWVPYHAGARLLHHAALATGREDFGLMVGERLDYANLGLLAMLTQRAPTVGEALQTLVRYFHLHDRGAVLYLRANGAGIVILGYAVHDAAITGIAYAYDLAIRVAVTLLHALCGPNWRAREVRLPHSRPAASSAWRRSFGAPVVFNASAAEVWFDASWLGQPPPFADLQMQHALLRTAQQIESKLALPLAERTRHLARALAMTGALSADNVADLLALNSRTLRRRLAAECTSFSTVVAGVRFDIAQQLLRDTDMPLGDIADALGYSDLTAFVRAFRGWAKCPPGQWREARKRPPTAP